MEAPLLPVPRLLLAHRLFTVDRSAGQTVFGDGAGHDIVIVCRAFHCLPAVWSPHERQELTHRMRAPDVPRLLVHRLRQVGDDQRLNISGRQEALLVDGVLRRALPAFEQRHRARLEQHDRRQARVVGFDGHGAASVEAAHEGDVVGQPLNGQVAGRNEGPAPGVGFCSSSRPPEPRQRVISSSEGCGAEGSLSTPPAFRTRGRESNANEAEGSSGSTLPPRVDSQEQCQERTEDKIGRRIPRQGRLLSPLRSSGGWFLCVVVGECPIKVELHHV